MVTLLGNPCVETLADKPGSASASSGGLALRGDRHGDAWLVASAAGTGDADWPAESYRWAADTLASAGLEVAHERIFGSLAAEACTLRERAAAFRACGVPCDTPVTYVEGLPAAGEQLAGWIIHAIARTSLDQGVRTLTKAGIPRGRAWSRAGRDFVTLQALGGSAHSAAERPHAVTRTLHEVAKLLACEGMSYRDVARTWFYIEGILDWYEEFNEARRSVYRRAGLAADGISDPPSFPASTGVGAAIPRGGACSLDLVAARARASGDLCFRPLLSAVQKDPWAYGSAFSRGTATALPEGTLIQLSGTAAIGEDGRTMFPGDTRAQINCTLDAVDHLLASEGATMRDITAATAFFKHRQDAALLDEALRARKLPPLPAVCVVADICREELLFELDAELLALR